MAGPTAQVAVIAAEHDELANALKVARQQLRGLLRPRLHL
jgi:hypothetical protein